MVTRLYHDRNCVVHANRTFCCCWDFYNCPARRCFCRALRWRCEERCGKVWGRFRNVRALECQKSFMVLIHYAQFFFQGNAPEIGGSDLAPFEEVSFRDFLLLCDFRQLWYTEL